VNKGGFHDKKDSGILAASRVFVLFEAIFDAKTFDLLGGKIK
jgi:hypothetical protein